MLGIGTARSGAHWWWETRASSWAGGTLGQWRLAGTVPPDKCRPIRPHRQQRELMSNVGAIAANLHEGSRSEYLAQYVFASFGTAVPVLHQEDAGIDLYCTLTERVGKLAWPKAHFTVQVKSTVNPVVLGSQDSVAWLIKHPFPLLICCVDKKTLRFLVYHTFIRYQIWVRAKLPERLELTPGEGHQGRAEEWTGGPSAPLGAPVLDFDLRELLDLARHAHLKEVLEFWLSKDAENILHVSEWMREYTMPINYLTNSLEFTGAVTHIGHHREDLDRTREMLGRVLPYAAQNFLSAGDLPGAARCAILLRHLKLKRGLGAPHVAMAINHALGLTDDLLEAGVDELSMTFDRLLSEHKRSRSTGEDA